MMSWMFRLLRGGRLDRELGAELRDHLERQVADYVHAGMSEREARRQALLAIGGVERVKEECRDARGTMWAEQIGRDLIYGARHLRRTPALSIAVITTLALTIGAGATLFTLLNAVTLRRLPVPDPDRLAVLSLTDQSGQRQRLFYYSTFEEFATHQKVFENVCAYAGGGIFALEARGVLADATVAAMTPECTALLGLRPITGRVLGPADASGLGEPARVVVLGHRFWRRAFNSDPNAVGEQLVVDGVPLTIVGVLPPDFPGLHVDTGSDFYIPLTLLVRLSGDPKRPIRFYNIVGRLRPGVTLEQARAVVIASWPALQASTLPPGLSAAQQDDARAQRVQVDSGARGFSTLREQYSRPLVGLVSLAAVLLLISCVNLSGLLLTRAVAREQQFAVSLALGASRFRLVRQLMIESLLLSIAGVLFAIPTAHLACGAVAALMWDNIVPLAMSLTPDVRVLGIVGSVGILAGIAVGVLPAIAGTRSNPHLTLLRGGTQTPSARRWSKTFLVAQVALSLTLLFAAGLFTTSLGTLRSLDSGFRDDGVIFTRAWQHPGPRRAYDEQSYYPTLVERLSALPGVQSVALSHYFPAYFKGAPPMHVISRTELTDRGEVEGFAEFISPRFFETVGARVVRGRDFTWADRAGAPAVVIINEALERRLFPGGDAIGRRIRLGTDPRRQALEIVGVTSDITVGDLRSPHAPVAFRPRLQEPQYMRVPIVTLRVGGDVEAVAPAVGPAIRSLGYEYIRDISTLNEQMDRSLIQERLLAGLSSVFAGVALLLAFIGVYSLLIHAVSRRTREVGLRMAIGASRTSVLRMITREAVYLTLAGIILGIPLALWVGRLTRALIFGVEPTDPRVLGIAVIIFMAIGAVAGWLPGRRASRIDPMTALRYE
jgi:predicted permease